MFPILMARPFEEIVVTKTFGKSLNDNRSAGVVIIDLYFLTLNVLADYSTQDL